MTEKDRIVNVRMSSEEYDLLKEKAAIAGKSVSELVRDRISDDEPGTFTQVRIELRELKEQFVYNTFYLEMIQQSNIEFTREMMKHLLNMRRILEQGRGQGEVSDSSASSSVEDCIDSALSRLLVFRKGLEPGDDPFRVSQYEEMEDSSSQIDKDMDMFVI